MAFIALAGASTVHASLTVNSNSTGNLTQGNQANANQVANSSTPNSIRQNPFVAPSDQSASTTSSVPATTTTIQYSGNLISSFLDGVVAFFRGLFG
ncbi:MAG: hypothetical protein ACREBH_02550 [Candidatus Micrarchaeaceae archaeon]